MRGPRLALLCGWMVLLARLCGAGEYPFATRVADMADPEMPEWIEAPASERAPAGLYLFRKRLTLPEVPRAFPVHVSADPRYKLYVNGRFVVFGPCAGDPLAWHYESVDLAPYLKAGDNVIGIELWDAGPGSPARQVSLRAGVVLRGPRLGTGPLITDGTWRVRRSRGWSALAMDSATVGGGYIAGATEAIDAAQHPWGWSSAGFDDAAWPSAVVIGKASNGRLDTWEGTPWPLTPRSVPLLTMAEEPAGRIRVLDTGGGVGGAAAWPITIPARATARLLFDRDSVVLGFPRLALEGGTGATVTLRYQESLFEENGRKSRRDAIEGKTMKGYFDRFVADGAARVFEPAWVRTYRYLEVQVETQEAPLILRDLTLRRVRYPFDRRGAFSSSDDSLTDILDACWRTVDVCALETYMDCPYYEQVQYIGDTRIQALISLYMTGDDRLMRQAIAQFDRSRQPNGLTRSAYPVAGGAPQLIPPFSLIYVSMVHDYHMHRDDPAFVRALLPGIRFTLEWFLARLDERGLLGPLPYWNHTDGGAAGFQAGSPPGASTGGSIQLTLLLVAALQDASRLFAAHGRAAEAAEFATTAARVQAAARTHGFDPARQLFAETPEKTMFTQHTNALAILTGTVAESERAALAERLVTDRSLVQGTLYFQFYIFAALREAGRGELILGELDRWRAMLTTGLTTFPEHGPESRSDAHAWAAHPLYHLLATTAGVMPETPGFRRVRIRPALGTLQQIDATVCHPAGLIRVRVDDAGPGEATLEIELPPGVSGTLEWSEIRRELQPGHHRLTLPREGSTGAR